MTTAQAPRSKVLAPWRERMGPGLAVAANLSLVAATGLVAYREMSVERSSAILFAAVALTCVLHGVSGALQRRLNMHSVLVLATVGSGCGLAATAATWLT